MFLELFLFSGLGDQKNNKNVLLFLLRKQTKHWFHFLLVPQASRKPQTNKNIPETTSPPPIVSRGMVFFAFVLVFSRFFGFWAEGRL